MTTDNTVRISQNNTTLDQLVANTELRPKIRCAAYDARLFNVENISAAELNMRMLQQEALILRIRSSKEYQLGARNALLRKLGTADIDFDTAVSVLTDDWYIGTYINGHVVDLHAIGDMFEDVGDEDADFTNKMLVSERLVTALVSPDKDVVVYRPHNKQHYKDDWSVAVGKDAHAMYVQDYKRAERFVAASVALKTKTVEMTNELATELQNNNEAVRKINDLATAVIFDEDELETMPEMGPVERMTDLKFLQMAWLKNADKEAAEKPAVRVKTPKAPKSTKAKKQNKSK